MTHVAREAWEDAAPGNVAGVTRALTTLGAMPRWALLYERTKFMLRRLFGPPPELERLGFIHFARAALLTRDWEGKKLKPAYVYFESHFNGTFDAYIDAFAYVVPGHLRKIWDQAYDFRGPQPAEQFKAYIRKHDYAAAHFYSAYREATATDIQLALALCERMRPLGAHIDRLAPPKFANRFYRALPEPGPQNKYLAAVRYAAKFIWFKVTRRDRNFAVGGDAYGLSPLLPIQDGHEEDLAQALRTLEQPFAGLGRTHFGRLVMIDPFPTPEKEPDGRKPGPHLLLSCVIDGEPESYLRQLYAAEPELVDAIWAHCSSPTKPRNRDAAGFARWLRTHQLQTGTFFAPYPNATVQEVKAALKLAERLRELAGTAHERTESGLRAEFRARIRG